MKHVALKWLGMIAWGVTSLVAINEGLKAFGPGYDFFQSEFFMIYNAAVEQKISKSMLLRRVFNLGVDEMKGLCPECNTIHTGREGCPDNNCNEIIARLENPVKYYQNMAEPPILHTQKTEADMKEGVQVIRNLVKLLELKA